MVLVELPHELNEAQVDILNHGLWETSCYNPIFPGDADREKRHWLVVRDDIPIGVLGISLGEPLPELSVNFFVRPAPLRLVSAFIAERLAEYPTLMAKAYHWNTRVIRLLDRVGDYVDHEGDVDYYRIGEI